MNLKEFQESADALVLAKQHLSGTVKLSGNYSTELRVRKCHDNGNWTNFSPEATEMFLSAISRLMPTILAEAHRLIAEKQKKLAEDAQPLLNEALAQCQKVLGLQAAAEQPEDDF